MIRAVVLTFCLWSGDAADLCPWQGEEGTITAATCAAAETYVRAGMRPGQHLHIQACQPLTHAEAQR
jgi:hypothetical protein